MKNFFSFLLIFYIPATLVAGTATSINGSWKTMSPNYRNKLWIYSAVHINPPQIKYVFTAYETLNGKKPYWEHIIEGSIKSITKSSVSNDIINADISVLKNTYTFKASTVPPKLEKCVKKNVPLDVIAAGCGVLLRERAIHNIYDSFMVLSENEILSGIWNNFPRKPSKRPNLMSIHPLFRVRSK